MKKAFVDTTILVDRLLKFGNQRTRAQRSLARYERTELPVYAIKEFRAGPFYNLAWAHNKLVELKSVPELIRIIGRWRAKPNLVSTILEFYANSQDIIGPKSLPELNAKYAGSVSHDDFQCRVLRLNLESTLRRAWVRRRRVTSETIQELPCFDEAKPIMKAGLFDQERMGCKPSGECALVSSLRANPEHCRVLREISKAQESPEGRRRAKALRKVVRTPAAGFGDKDCRNLGDAYFAFFCPRDSVILTTNTRDHSPLASGLGKTVEKP